MADARLRGEWLGALDFDSLSDTAWRVFSSALMWSVEQGTNGLIPTRYLKSLHPDGEKADAFTEIVKIGKWSRVTDGYQLTDWAGALGQSTAEEVETYKQNARERQRRYREKQSATLAAKSTRGDRPTFTDDSATGDVTGDVTVAVTRDVGKGKGEGTDNQQSGKAKSEVVAARTVTTWQTKAIPDSDPDSTPSLAPKNISAGARCSVAGCDGKLYSPEALASGLCKKGDATHELARRREGASA